MAGVCSARLACSVEFGGLVDVGGHVLGQAAGSRVFEGGRVQVLQPQLLCLCRKMGRIAATDCASVIPA